MKSSDIFYACRYTPILLKSRTHDSGVNQYGLKPVNSYDYLNPTNLVNFGRGTSFDNLGVRRSERGQIDSAPSLGGTPVFTQAKLLGLSGDDQLRLCESETTQLRVCMAKGGSTCERESLLLDSCLSKVGHLRRAISQAGSEFNDWFIQNVSDNHTKPFQHRPHDWRAYYAQEKLVREKQQNGHAYGRRPKEFSFGARYVKTEGYGKRPRLPYNKSQDQRQTPCVYSRTAPNFLFHMAAAHVASGKTLREDTEIFFDVSRNFSVPGKSRRYQSPHTFNQLIRSRLQQRNRFNHDHHDTCMYIERSKNANVVAYTANLVDAATGERVESGIGRQCVLYREDPLHAYFVNLEPSYIENRRRKGLQYDCDDLNLLERTMAYGCSATAVNTEGILEYWGTNTPEALTSVWAESKVVDSDVLPDEDLNSEDAGGERVSASDATSALPHNNALMIESLDAALGAWWASFNPYISHFVALPTWPGILICLPPVAKVDSIQRRSSTAVELPKSTGPTPAPLDDASDPHEAEAKSPIVYTTNVTYGNHTEPAETTATTGVLSDEDTVVVILVRISGELSVLEKVYVKSVEPKRFYNLPRVEYIEVFGVSLETGQPTYEKKLS